MLDPHAVDEMLDEIADAFFQVDYHDLDAEDKCTVIQIAADCITSQNPHGL